MEDVIEVRIFYGDGKDCLGGIYWWQFGPLEAQRAIKALEARRREESQRRKRQNSSQKRNCQKKFNNKVEEVG